jgi:hypothetical protein
MITRSVTNRTDQHLLDLFDFTTVKKPERARLRRRIKEVIYGRRPAVKIYSSRLQSELWLVNEGLVDPADAVFAGKAITMQVLAELMLEREKSTQILQEILRRTPC